MNENPQEPHEKPDSSFFNRLLRSRPLTYFLMGLGAAFGGLLIYGSTQYLFDAFHQPVPSPSAIADVDKKIDNGSHELKKTSESFRAISKKVGPAVVNIQSKKGNPKSPRASRRDRRNEPEGEDEGDMEGPLREFFERFGLPFPYHGEDFAQTSLGSGIIIDPKGIVVTNNHVIEDATEILLSLSTERIDLKAKIIGTDPRSDIAVLKIEKPGTYPVAQWADSDSVEVGDWAIAIGSPFALGQSMTVGIVSAKGRNAQGLTGADFAGDLIQTDAAINPGNSGGPLCDLDGRIMGMNTAIYTRSGGYMGIGFAIPSNLVKDVVSRLIKDGKIVRGWMGVYIQPVDEDLAKELGILDSKTGVIGGVGIHEVVEGSPAEKAGLKAGDVIIDVDGKPVKDPTKLQQSIGSFKPGQSVDIKILSYATQKSKIVRVKIGTLPDKQASPKKPSSHKPDKLGLIVEESKDGVRIETVQPGSVADQLSLEAGDVITQINRDKVGSLEKYKKLIQSKKLSVEIKRGGRTLFFRLTLPE